MDDRRARFGANFMPKKELESWWSLFGGSFGDEVLIILIVVALLPAKQRPTPPEMLP